MTDKIELHEPTLRVAIEAVEASKRREASGAEVQSINSIIVALEAMLPNPVSWAEQAVDEYLCERYTGGSSAELKRALLSFAQRLEANPDSFQSRVQPWLLECFGAEIASDKLERSDRFIEEALELVQSCGYPKERALALVDYVFGRPVGEPVQEVGGVMVTLASLCLAHGMDMHDAGEIELARISAPEIVLKIRAKQAAKPTGSALPVATDSQPERRAVSEEEIEREVQQYSTSIDDRLHYEIGMRSGIDLAHTKATEDEISAARKDGMREMVEFIEQKGWVRKPFAFRDHFGLGDN